jgi:hypothetical protein
VIDAFTGHLFDCEPPSFYGEEAAICLILLGLLLTPSERRSYNEGSASLPATCL